MIKHSRLIAPGITTAKLFHSSTNALQQEIAAKLAEKDMQRLNLLDLRI
jgi:hypothetical protein